MPGRPDSPPTRALAWLYSPAAQRPALALLCALEREIGASLRAGVDHEVAHARLDWWREECARLARGEPAHPLTRELGALFSPTQLVGVTGLVDTAVWDLAAATFGTRRELSGYCERWSAAMIEPLAMRAAPQLAPGSLRELGAALCEIELLLALAPDARAGRLRLPLDELEQARTAPASLARPPWPTELVALVRERHRQLRSALAAAVAAMAPLVQASLRGILVWSAIDCARSLRAQARLPDASLTRDHHAPLDGWRAWRAAHRADTGRGLPRTG